MLVRAVGYYRQPAEHRISGKPGGQPTTRAKDAAVQVGSLCFFYGVRLLKNTRSKAYFLRLWNRSTQMPLVRHYSAIFQDQLQAPYIGDVIERIVGDHNQVSELARLHRA